MAKAGRRAKLADEKLVESLCDQIRYGLTVKNACAFVGISPRSFFSWKAEGEKLEQAALAGKAVSKRDAAYLRFLHAIQKAEAEFCRNQHVVIGAASRQSWQAAAWLLERRRPGEYSLGPLRSGGEDETADIFHEARITTVAMEGTMRGIVPPHGLLPKAWTTFRWTVEQMRMLSSTARFIAMPCGRGSGKTAISFRRLVIALAIKKEWDDPRYFYTAPTNPQAMRIAWDAFGELIPKSWIRSVRRTDQYYETIFGSRLYILGMDIPARIEGLQWDGGVEDEASDQKPGSFNRSIRPALTHRNGWAYRIGVPKRHGMGSNDYREWCEAALRGEVEDRETHSWESEIVLPKEEIEAARRTLDMKDFNEQFKAKWENAGGGIFWAWDRAFNAKNVVYRTDCPIAVSCDFNRDPMCWVIGHRFDNELHIFDELFVRDTTTNACMDEIWSRYSEHKAGFEFFGDASGGHRDTRSNTTDWAIISNDKRFKRAGRNVYVSRASPSLKSRFASTNALFLNAAGQRRCFVNPKCVHLISDIENRVYKPGTSEPLDPKGSDMGHMTDALGYIIWRQWPVRIELDDELPGVIMTDGHGGIV
jgi:hypothetical protein